MQIERCLGFGFRPTHMDSHMGTLFASPAFMERYIKLGIEYKIPVMFPGGHNTLITPQIKALGMEMKRAREVGNMLWNAGLPVLDDLHNDSYSPHLPPGTEATPENLRKYKTQYYINALKSCKPGVTYMIMHCSIGSPLFKYITSSGPVREGDYLAMINPELKAFIHKEGIILTTMKELMERRSRRL